MGVLVGGWGESEQGGGSGGFGFRRFRGGGRGGALSFSILGEDGGGWGGCWGLALALERKGGLSCGFTFPSAILLFSFPFPFFWGGGVGDEVGDGVLGFVGGK